MQMILPLFMLFLNCGANNAMEFAVEMDIE